MRIRPIKTRIFREGEDLIEFIDQYSGRLKEGCVVVVTSKIVALSEGRTVKVTGTQTKERLIRAESNWMRRTKYTWLTVKDGTVMASAGIDESNANGKLILLPRDAYGTASRIRRALMKRRRIKKLGVLISDSRILPLRAGAVGIALGYAGFSGIRDYRGMPDLFGRKLIYTRADVADSLATAAVVLMGEAAERQPLAVIEEAPIVFTNRVNRKELHIDPREDLYRPFFENIKKIYQRRGRRHAI